MATKRKFMTIDYEVADSITLCNLRECVAMMESESIAISEMETIPAHKAEDLVYNIQMIKHLHAVIKYFGG